MSKLSKLLSAFIIGVTIVAIVFVLNSRRPTPTPMSTFSGQAEDVIYGLGRLATSEEITGWHIDARPDGHGLPEGRGSVLEGKVLYEEQCAACHGESGEGVDKFPTLVGGQGSLTTDKPLKTIGSYWPYSSTLWDYTARAMPFGNARSLRNDEVYALTAYILHLNGLLTERDTLDHDTLIAVKMPNAGSFFTEANKVKVKTHDVPCMESCKSGVNVKTRAKLVLKD